MNKNFLKIITFNILVFLITILIIEIFFGGWFRKDNFGAYFREHRMKKVPYKINYDGKEHEFVYLRNYYGFIGEEIEPKDIHSVFIGGSTADERWKPRHFSIVEQINKKLAKDSIDIRITNAGIEGQTTIGYIANFKFWFPKLKEFNPKFFIFYTGINELLRQDYNTFDYADGYAKLITDDKRDRLADTIKSKSISYDLLRKTKHNYYTRESSIFMDLDASIKKYPFSKYSKKVLKGKNYNYLNFNNTMKEKNMENLVEKEKDFINFYLKNIDTLANYSKEYSAIPIFINQATAYGAHIERHLILNYSLKKHCIDKKYYCIDLAGELDGKLEYWYDGAHTTPLGSKIIADEIYPLLKEMLK